MFRKIGDLFGAEIQAGDVQGAYCVRIAQCKRTTSLLEALAFEFVSIEDERGLAWCEFSVDQVEMSAVFELVDFIGNLIYGPRQETEEAVRFRAETKRQKVNHSGFVYVMKCMDAYKIGMAVDVQKRADDIYPVMPYPLEIVLSIKTDDRFLLEKSLHERFAKQRLLGEWFTLSDLDIESIRTEFPANCRWTRYEV